MSRDVHRTSLTDLTRRSLRRPGARPGLGPIGPHEAIADDGNSPEWLLVAVLAVVALALFGSAWRVYRRPRRSGRGHRSLPRWTDTSATAKRILHGRDCWHRLCPSGQR